MSNKRNETIDTNESTSTEDTSTDTNPSTKLERRRRIEDLFEEKRLREELGEFDIA